MTNTDGTPTWHRFQHGEFTCTVVSDGPLYLGPARESFPAVSPSEVDALLVEAGLPTDRVVLDQNLLVVDTGRERILFDTGTGSMPDLGRRVYGPQCGHAVENLEAAGISPADIGVVALTHAHPDHAWGLLDSAGQPRFPNAKVIIGDADYTHFTDPTMAEKVINPRIRNQYTGARISLLPYGDRVVRVGDGYQVADGITAVTTPGHSPGHLVYEIISAGKRLAVWGDLCHHPILLERPRWSFVFDGDRGAAAGQRLRIFDKLVENESLILSYHFPFPGVGKLSGNGESYTWHPVRI